VFLAEMDQVVPWKALLALIEPHYPKMGRPGRFLRTPAGTFRALDPNGFLNHGVFGRNLCPGGSATCFSPHPNY
jgi:hypothetical protein